MITALITQSNYIPWKGYFDAIEASDVFVLYDIAQYTRRDWRNRNRIKTAGGLKWLTIPVQVRGKYHQAIDETLVSDHSWAERHWKTIRHEYTRARCFGQFEELFADLFAEAGSIEKLTDINVLFLHRLCSVLGIDTEFRQAREFHLDPGLDSTARLVSLCKELGADRYLTGPAASSYLDEQAFRDAGVVVDWLDYSGYSQYSQLHGSFEHRVSIIDVMLNEGNQAPLFIKRSEPS